LPTIRECTDPVLFTGTCQMTVSFARWMKPTSSHSGYPWVFPLRVFKKLSDLLEVTLLWVTYGSDCILMLLSVKYKQISKRMKVVWHKVTKAFIAYEWREGGQGGCVTSLELRCVYSQEAWKRICTRPLCLWLIQSFVIALGLMHSYQDFYAHVLLIGLQDKWEKPSQKCIRVVHFFFDRPSGLRTQIYKVVSPLSIFLPFSQHLLRQWGTVTIIWTPMTKDFTYRWTWQYLKCVCFWP
jgi:hypothetical protein